METAPVVQTAGGASVQAIPASVHTPPPPREAVSPPVLVRRVEIVGSSLPTTVKARLEARFTGRPLDAATGARAVRALEAAYRRADVALAQVGGPGLGADGVLTLAVLEGRLEGVDVEGGSARERRAAHLYARRLLREAPLTRSSYERATALIALTPGVKAGFGFTVTPRPGVLRLKVVLQAVRARVDVRITNRGAVAFGAWQGRADARAFSLFKGGDQAVLTVAATPDAHRLRLVGGTYVLPLGTDGLTLAASATHVEADPYRAGLSNRGDSVQAALAYPLVLRWDRSLTGALVADGQDGQTAAGALVPQDERTRNLRLALTGARLFGAGDSATGDLVLTGGVPGAGARAAHPGYAPTRYAKVAAFGGLATPYGPWTVRLHAAGQTAGSRLPFSEQFVLGGDDYGRGFQAVSLQGDDGVAASAELALTLRRGAAAGTELYGYLDGGGVRVRDRPGLRGGDGGLASVGAGVRIGVGPGAGLELSADRGIAYRNPYGGPDRTGWRFGVRLRLAYAPGSGGLLNAPELTGPAPFSAFGQ